MTPNPRDEAAGEESGEDDAVPPAGPTDHGGKGGMATREVAPEIAEGNPRPAD